MTTQTKYIFFSHQESSVGVAIVDMDTKKFYMGEIPDDDYYSNLEAFIVQKSPKECLVPAEYLTENKNKIVAVSKDAVRPRASKIDKAT